MVRAALLLFVCASPAMAQPGKISEAAGERRIAIEYVDLTGTQPPSSAPFVTHVAGAHLFELGKPASLGIQELAENGNPEFVLGGALFDPKTFRDIAVGLPSLPGHGRKVELTVDAAHPMVSGGWMLGATNDGFAGIDAVDAFHLDKAVVIDVYALDAGTKKNSEAAAETAALGGLGRTPEHGLVARHTGIRGDADIPASFKFDPDKPVGRVTVAPVGPNG